MTMTLMMTMIANTNLQWRVLIIPFPAAAITPVGPSDRRCEKLSRHFKWIRIEKSGINRFDDNDYADDDHDGNR